MAAELSGRLCELSAGPDGALLSAAMSVVLDAQRHGEPVVWVTALAATFYPPDVVACGVDLSALVVVRALGARAAGRAADVLLRSADLAHFHTFAIDEYVHVAGRIMQCHLCQ